MLYTRSCFVRQQVFTFFVIFFSKLLSLRNSGDLNLEVSNNRNLSYLAV